MKCNGCGTEIDNLGGTLSYGEPLLIEKDVLRDTIDAGHHKTLCEDCKEVLKRTLLENDLSEYHNARD